MATFKILDANGKVIQQAEKSFGHYKRYSMQAAAEQKFLDSLYVPEAAEGRIDFGLDYKGDPWIVCFRFVGGRSMHYFPAKPSTAVVKAN